MNRCAVCTFISLIMLTLTASALYADVDLRLNSVDMRTTQAYVGQRVYTNFSVTTLAEASGDKTFWIDIKVLSDPNDTGSSVYSIGYGSGFFPPDSGETRDNYLLEFELNAVVDPGNYFVHVTVTPASPPDTNPGDNAKSSTTPFNVPPRAGPADVLVTNCSIHNHYLKDRSLPISGSTAYLNNSLATANDVSVGIYLSLDAVITEDDILLAKENVGTLPDPYYRTFYFSVPIDPDIPDGNYYAGALITASNDSNSSNNVSLDGHFPVLIGGPPKPKPGTLSVFFSPGEVQDKAAWRLVGDDGWLKHGQSMENLNPGEYKIEFRPVTGYVTPAKRTAEIKSDSPTVITVAYGKEPITPIVETFEVLPSDVYPGEPARIVWKVKNVDSVNILPALGPRGESGSYPIDTVESTEFRLSASNNDGTVSKSAKFRVIDSRKIELFTSNSTASNPLHTSETVKLYWSTRGLSDLTIDTDEDGIADVSANSSSGFKEITLAQSGSVRLFGLSDRGNASEETYVHITNLPVVRSFELPRGPVLPGAKVALRWKIPGLQTATIEPFGITVDKEEGVYRFVATESMKISIDAINQYGSVSKSQKLRLAKNGTDLTLRVKNLSQRNDGSWYVLFGDASEFTADVTVTNIGRGKARNFFVSMYANGLLVDRKRVNTALRSGQSVNMQLSHMPTHSNTIPIRIVVDDGETLPDLHRNNNAKNFKLLVSIPKKAHAWINNVELRRIGTKEREQAVMLNFAISQLGGNGKSLYFYRVKFFKKRNKGGEGEAACVEGFAGAGFSGRHNRFEVMRMLRLDEKAFNGRIEIEVMNMTNNNGFLEPSRTRSFTISEILVGN